MEYRGERGELLGTGGKAIRVGPWTVIVGSGPPPPPWKATVTVDQRDDLADLAGTTVLARFHDDDSPTVIEGPVRLAPQAITTGDGRHLHEAEGSGELRWPR